MLTGLVLRFRRSPLRSIIEVVDIGRRDWCRSSDRRFVMGKEVTLYDRLKDSVVLELLRAIELLCSDRRVGDGALEQEKSLAGNLPLTLTK